MNKLNYITISVALVSVSIAQEAHTQTISDMNSKQQQYEQPDISGSFESRSGITLRNFPVGVVGESSDGPVSIVTETDNDGNFYIYDLDPGTYNIFVDNNSDNKFVVVLQEKDVEWYEFWETDSVVQVDIGKNIVDIEQFSDSELNP